MTAIAKVSVPAGFASARRFAAVVFEKSGIERRLIESLLAGRWRGRNATLVAHPADAGFG